MPNWCSNTLSLSHEDPKEIARAVEAFKRGELLQELVPNPSGEWDYDWSVNNWGTKWDVGGRDANDPEVSEDGKTATFWFDSAWAPPTTAYDAMCEAGFGVEAMYYEPGMAFAGIYSDGADDNYDLSAMDSRAVQNAIPTELDAEFGISEMLAEDEEEEPLTEWYVDGAKAKGLIKNKESEDE